MANQRNETSGPIDALRNNIAPFAGLSVPTIADFGGAGYQAECLSAMVNSHPARLLHVANENFAMGVSFDNRI